MNTTSEPPPSAPLWGESPESNLAAYRPVSRMAVSGLLLGLASPLAFTSPLLWILPAVGAALSVIALLTIRARERQLTGVKAAWLGLCLSIIFGSAAPTSHFTYHQWIVKEARTVARHWLDLLRTDDPYTAHQWTLGSPARAPATVDLPRYYVETPAQRQTLQQFVDDSFVHTLLALGPSATVRDWETGVVLIQPKSDYVQLVLAITYPQAGKATTFFCGLSLERTKPAKDKQVDWRIASYRGGIRPPSF